MYKNSKYVFSKEEKNIFEIFFSLKGKKKYKEAFEILNPFVESYPKNYKIFFLLGSILYQDGNFRTAVEYLKKAVALKPEHMLSSLNLVHALGELNRWQTAFREINRFLSISSKNRIEHLLLIQELYEGRNNFSTSEKELINKLNSDFRIINC